MQILLLFFRHIEQHSLKAQRTLLQMPMKQGLMDFEAGFIFSVIKRTNNLYGRYV